MAEEKLPGHYLFERQEHKDFMQAVEQLGQTIRSLGPIDAKTAHLIQMAAAITTLSQGSTHSHVRRALEAGATPEEIYHAIILLTSTIGFPTVAAALSWADDVIPDPGAIQKAGQGGGQP